MGGRAGSKPSLARVLEQRLKAPLGDTLLGLSQIRLATHHLELGPDVRDWADVPQLEKTLGIVIVGKTENGFFGPVRAELGNSASDAPWIYADRQALPPEGVGTLAQFLSLWCFYPGFFELHDKSAKELTALHHDFFTSNGSARPLVQKVLGLPGVARLTGVDAAKLVKRVGGLVTPEPPPPPREEVTEETGQSFEETMRRIKAIEKKAIARLRNLSGGRISPKLPAFGKRRDS